MSTLGIFCNDVYLNRGNRNSRELYAGILIPMNYTLICDYGE